MWISNIDPTNPNVCIPLFFTYCASYNSFFVLVKDNNKINHTTSTTQIYQITDQLESTITQGDITINDEQSLSPVIPEFMGLTPDNYITVQSCSKKASKRPFLLKRYKHMVPCNQKKKINTTSYQQRYSNDCEM